MLFSKISTLILLALTASAAPVKRQSGSEGVPEPWEIGVTIIPGQGPREDSPYTRYPPGSTGNCGNSTNACHELCHVDQQLSLPDQIQCEDECYREESIRCYHDEEEKKQQQQFGTPGDGNPAPGASGTR